MHFATLILPLASLAHAILTPTPPGQKLYHLKTRAANTTAKNDLYVSAYHNGSSPSGFSTLSTSATEAHAH